MNNQQKQQVLEQIKSANNVLVTVSANPTVDELAASVGFTLALNKLGKHATTVFSGVVPSTIEFLQPEDTIETTTDSLRDFIIALDKSKADKLRYKVEDDVVRIFITPYKTTISDKDLEFSHGDFNVDVVVALGVTRREDLDNAVTAHGRILHDAVVISLTRDVTSELGSVNWQEPQASSLCEMVGVLTTELGADVLDGQMATAFLTGIIAETDRFKNEKTTPAALGLSSQLMSAGANQQLIAEKLEEPQGPPVPLHGQGGSSDTESDDGTLSIEHDNDEENADDVGKIHIDEQGNIGPHSDQGHEDEPVEASEQQENNQPPSSLPLPDQPSEQWGASSGEENPTLPQNVHNDQVLTHSKKVITPPSEEEQQLTDEPFDLNAAIHAANSDNASGDSGTSEEPQDNSARDGETPKIQSDHAGPMLSQPPSTVPQEEVTSPPDQEEEKPSGAPQAEPHETAEQTGSEASSIPAPIVEEIHSSVPIPPPQDQGSAADTLTQLEQAVDSPHAGGESVDQARAAVANAADAQLPAIPTPQQSVGAQNVDLQKVAEEVSQAQPEPTQETVPEVHDPTAPPPVPPPMSAPQFYDADGNNQNPFTNPS